MTPAPSITVDPPHLATTITDTAPTTITDQSCAHNCKLKCKHKCCRRRKQQQRAEQKLIEEEQKLKSKPTSHSATHPKPIAGCQLCLHSAFPKTVKRALTSFQRSIADVYFEHLHEKLLKDKVGTPWSINDLMAISIKLEKWQQLDLSDHKPFSRGWLADGMDYIDDTPPKAYRDRNSGTVIDRENERYGSEFDDPY
jgi:hypothetical protein